MMKVWLKKYFAIVFVLATLLGSQHHHDDLKQHSDCQICTVQSSLSHADTPADSCYLSDISPYSEATIGSLASIIVSSKQIISHARAPPKHS